MQGRSDQKKTIMKVFYPP